MWKILHSIVIVFNCSSVIVPVFFLIAIVVIVFWLFFSSFICCVHVSVQLHQPAKLCTCPFVSLYLAIDRFSSIQQSPHTMWSGQHNAAASFTWGDGGGTDERVLVIVLCIPCIYNQVKHTLQASRLLVDFSSYKLEYSSLFTMTEYDCCWRNYQCLVHNYLQPIVK